MADIVHRIGIKAPMAQVHAALATIPGLSGWWTSDTTGSAQEGGNVVFTFKTPAGDTKGQMNFKVNQVTPNSIKWTCAEGPEEWIGTNATFDMSTADDMTILIFGHRNWKEQSEGCAHCSMKWATFLLSLRSYVETGKGMPSPNDLKIDNWN